MANQQERYNQFMAEQQQSQSQHSGNYPIDNSQQQSPVQNNMVQPPQGYQLPPNSNGYPASIYNPQFQQPQQPQQQPISSGQQQQQHRFMAYQAPTAATGYNVNPGFIPQGFQRPVYQPDPTNVQLTPQQEQQQRMMYDMMYLQQQQQQQQQQQPRPDMPYNIMRPSPPLQQQQQQNIPMQHMVPPPPQFTNDMNPQVYQQRLHQYRQMIQMQQFNYMQHHQQPSHPSSDQRPPYPPPHPQYIQHQFRPTPQQYQQQMNMQNIRTSQFQHHQQLQLQHHNQQQQQQYQPARRSARATKKKKSSYEESSDEEELNLSEDSEPEPEELDESDDEDGSRKRRKGDDDSDEPIVIPMGTKEFERILDYRQNEDTGKEELLIKYKYTSFHHVDWVPIKQVEGEHLGKHRVKKFLRKWEEDGQRGEDFREYLKLDRIVDEGEIEDPTTGELKIYYLCKWNASFYDSCTWEKEEDAEKIDESKVEEFHDRRIIPDYKMENPPHRPDLSKFMKYDRSPTYRYGNELRSYQLEGLNWLRFCYYSYRSCILADEMGLGKTVQSVALLNDIYHVLGIKGPFIIIAPLSTIPHWERAFKAWTDLNVIDYRGSNLARNLIVDTEFYYKNTEGKNIPDRYKFDVLITTYEMASSSAPLLSKIRWKCAVFDEAHRLKNKQSKVLEILKTFYIEHKLLLTGTPLQNNLDELYSLLNFMQPEVFNDEAYFFSEYGSLQTAAQVEKLQALLKPIMLRRFKEDVEKTIPVKEETVVEVELTTPQKKWYRAILEKNFSFLKKGAKSNKEMPHLRNIMMQLRKCCIHPYLLEGAEEVIVSECNAVSPQDQFSCLVQSSGKLVLIDKLLKKLILGNHKVLIFSQFTSCLDILSDYLRKRKYAFERIDGTIPGDQRQAAIDRFSTLPIEESFVFLLCTRAGGVGINLTAADTCIIFDSDWNPQNDLQAQARCHRIGQTKPVQIYRLICANTYEKDMFDRAGMKLGLDKAVMSRSGPTGDNENGQSGKHELTKQEIEALLKKGAYGAMLDDEASTRFCEEDIDQILERRTKVIKHEGNEQGSVFSKATFSAGSGDVDGVDIDDPDFWEKWAAKANIDTTEVPEEKNKLILLGSRRRRQVQRFGTKQEDSNYSDNENEDSDGAYEDEDEDDEEGGRRRNNEEDGEEEEEGVGRRGRGRGTRSSARGGVTTRRGRGRRAASSAVSSPSNNSSGVGRKRGNGAGREGAPRLWTLSEKTKYERKLMIFGYGAWEQMKADFPRRSEKDLKAVTRILMKRTLPTIGKKTEEDKKLVDDIEQLLESDSKDDVPNDDTVPYKNATKKQTSEFRSFLIDATDDYIDHIERKGRNLLLRIQMLHIIRDKIVPKNWSVAKTMSMPQVAGAQPAKWWGKDEDRSLILGICKHGYQQYLDIRNDPEFCFYGKKYEDNDEDDEAATANNAKMDEEDEGGSGSDRETPSNEESKNAEKSATPAAEDEEVVIKEDEDSNVESTVADASIDNKNEQADDGDDEKDESYKDEAETAEEDGTVYVWPSKAEIGMRLRRVIAACIRVQSQDQRKRKAPAERKAPAARRVRRRGGGPGRRGGRPRRNTAAATEDVEESEDDTTSVNNENNNTNTATTPTAVEEEDEKEESVEKTESSTNKAEKEDTIDGKKEEKDQSITHEEDIKVKRENNNNTEDGDNNKTVGVENTISESNSNDIKKDMKVEQPVEEKDKVIKSEAEGGTSQLTAPIKEEENNSNEINNGRVDQVDSKDHVAEYKGGSIGNHQQQDGELSKDDKDESQTVSIKVDNEKAMLDKETDPVTSTESKIIAAKVDSIDDSNNTRSVDGESTKDVSTDVKENE